MSTSWSRTCRAGGLAIAALFALAAAAPAQEHWPYRPDDPNHPEWVRLMYGENPNVHQVDASYRAYFSEHEFEKSFHTQYYKRWRRRVDPHVDDRGLVRWPTPEQRQQDDQQYFERVGGGGGRRGQPDWEFVGPKETYSDARSGEHIPVSWQMNVYCIDRSASDPATLYCGTESGGLYKTTDSGANWSPVTDSGIRVYGVHAVKVHPSDPDIVFFGTGSAIYRSTDGGGSWTEVQTWGGMTVNDIAVHPADPSHVWAATSIGLFHSTDGGASFVREQTRAAYDIEFRPDKPDVMYLVRSQPAKNRAQFMRSNDRGATWKSKPNGWYKSSDPDAYDGGARIAVTAAKPRRVYAMLIGASKDGDDGFIGVLRSDDTGRRWTLPNGQVGGPYDDVHPNLQTISPYGGYHQGFYNLALAVSATDPDRLLAGGLNLWRSDDGSVSWSRVGGYGGPIGWIHPDVQDLKVFADEAWLTTDGGINRSTDMFNTHEARNNGVSASDFWGFGSGLSKDVLVGGRYHNGNAGFFEGYPAGRFLRLGGAEAPTGYVNPGLQRRTMHSDIGGILLPRQVQKPSDSFRVTKSPNESYFTAASSEFLWHPWTWNSAWIGRDQVLWRTDDLGRNWTEVHSFGSDDGVLLTDLDVGWQDPDLLYVVQQSTPRKLWKSLDGGASWTDVTPSSNVLGGNVNRNMVITLDPKNDQAIWLALAGGPDGYKVFRSLTGGVGWTNVTTNALDGQSPSAILFQAGSDRGVYLGTDGAVFYQSDNTGDWVVHGNAFPPNGMPVKMKALYSQGKLRAGCYRRAIWEVDLAEPAAPVARASADRLSGLAGEDFSFRSTSVLDEQGAIQFDWAFPGGFPLTSTERNPEVTYSAPGSYDVQLTVTDATGASDTTTVVGMIDVQ